MSNLKCPVCGEKIEHIEDGWCNCKNRCVGSGSMDLWLNFIRTRKALDIAVSQLKKTRDYIEDCRYQETNYFLVDSKDVSIIFDETNESLKEITALQQKDVK